MTTLHKVCELETACLSTLVLGMSSTARSLVMPMLTTPLREMVKADWPTLQNFSLKGSLPDDVDVWFTECLTSLILRMPTLRCLDISAALPVSTSKRCRVLNCSASPVVGLEGLRSLTIAYPDPNDAVFSTTFSDLAHLSLRDWPRHYDIVSHREYSNFWRSPILSATEALSVLQHLQVSDKLTTLELVYSTDEADDDLLIFITKAFPKLRHLQLHRYRRSPDETVDHVRVISTSTAPRCLRF